MARGWRSWGTSCLRAVLRLGALPARRHPWCSCSRAFISFWEGTKVLIHTIAWAGLCSQWWLQHTAVLDRQDPPRTVKFPNATQTQTQTMEPRNNSAIGHIVPCHSDPNAYLHNSNDFST